MKKVSIEELFDGIRNGDRVALSKAITLTESSLIEHQNLAQNLIQKLMPFTGNSKRIAITGVPGVGKSTFIEGFGKLLTQKSLKVAVLAIDPSSTMSGGSILGDKTRMEDLTRNPNAYIRPSATGGFLGGTSSRTYESLLLCEAAGFDVVLIETVGVGQSETMVNEMTDFFLFLQIPGGGDDLQGIKRGIMEMSDVIFINKVDNFGLEKAKEVKLMMARSLQFLPQRDSGWKPKVLMGSGLTGKGLDEVWNVVEDYYDLGRKSGYLTEKRSQQFKLRIKSYVNEQLNRYAAELYKQNPVHEVDLKENENNPYWIAKEWLEKNLNINQ